MSVDGLIVPPGQGKKLVTKAHEVTFKVTGEHSTTGSSFEVIVPPGFDVGAHTHTRSEELFYIVEGELDVLAFDPVTREGHWSDWESPVGAKPVRAGAGSVLFVPPGCPHAFANRTDTPVKMFFQASPPPDHEAYFDQLLEIFAAGGEIDASAVERLREKYDIQQITPLSYG
ncbi:cupin domain-containing protein [Streptomyces sp. NPDC001415]